MKAIMVNESGFEIELRGGKPTMHQPFTCPECNGGTNVIVDAKFLACNIRACPECYNYLVTEMDILMGFRWESWFPLDQLNRGERPLRFIFYRIRKFFKKIRKKWLKFKVRLLNIRGNKKLAMRRVTLKLMELDEIEYAMGRPVI